MVQTYLKLLQSWSSNQIPYEFQEVYSTASRTLVHGPLSFSEDLHKN